MEGARIGRIQMTTLTIDRRLLAQHFGCLEEYVQCHQCDGEGGWEIDGMVGPGSRLTSPPQNPIVCPVCNGAGEVTETASQFIDRIWEYSEEGLSTEPLEQERRWRNALSWLLNEWEEADEVSEEMRWSLIERLRPNLARRVRKRRPSKG